MTAEDKRLNLIKALAEYCTDDSEKEYTKIIAWNLLFMLHKKHTDWELFNKHGREQKREDSPSY